MNAFKNATLLQIGVHFPMFLLWTDINCILTYVIGTHFPMLLSCTDINCILTLCKCPLLKPKILVFMGIYQYLNRVPHFKRARLVIIGHAIDSDGVQSTIGDIEGQNEEVILRIVCIKAFSCSCSVCFRWMQSIRCGTPLPGVPNE
jgi:hypothetical protein